MVTPAEVQMDLSLEGDKSVKSHLLQGILDLFLETLNIYNNHLGDLKKLNQNNSQQAPSHEKRYQQLCVNLLQVTQTLVVNTKVVKEKI